MKRINISKEWLIEHYIDMQLSFRECGLQFGCSASVIRKNMIYHNIPIRTVSESTSGKLNYMFNWEFWEENGYFKCKQLYSKEFKLIRPEIFKRDYYTCQECEELLPKHMSVHHIDYDKNNNRAENLITLCGSCHSKTNVNRDIWEARYVAYQIERGC